MRISARADKLDPCDGHGASFMTAVNGEICWASSIGAPFMTAVINDGSSQAALGQAGIAGYPRSLVPRHVTRR